MQKALGASALFLQFPSKPDFLLFRRLSLCDNVQNDIVAETTVSLFDIPARLGTSIMTIFRDHDDDRDAEYLLIPRSKLVQTSPPLSS